MEYNNNTLFFMNENQDFFILKNPANEQIVQQIPIPKAIILVTQWLFSG